ncbi:hypothetical protein NIES21_18810 [Anabaenopsis circularis NIES-21]|uniref:Uncharacterized protein n=2 Tax=Nostocales TaxID=1161 RepID=A0A1Z4GFE7_9CYAN|nr:hypothetical protein [Nostoc cycadae]BAY16058.1 hypothetical protein NIES21_18810 [Anabaenopsis circularis NIES-21]GBE92464.1 hypothetical protein NCWK1_2220 [Nostoc cycadae WK-1]
MNFEKYSKQQFDACGLDTSAARQLADELQDDVAKEIHEVVLTAFLKVVEELNARGHNLTPYDEIQVGDIPFRDESSKERCNLRLACDIIISTGYSHTLAADEIEAAT